MSTPRPTTSTQRPTTSTRPAISPNRPSITANHGGSFASRHLTGTPGTIGSAGSGVRPSANTAGGLRPSSSSFAGRYGWNGTSNGSRPSWSGNSASSWNRNRGPGSSSNWNSSNWNRNSWSNWNNNFNRNPTFAYRTNGYGSSIGRSLLYTALGYPGLAYGGYGGWGNGLYGPYYGGYGYGGYGYRPYGYGYGYGGAYPWIALGTRLLFGIGGLGYNRYGYGGYGGYGYSSYSSSPTYVTNITQVPASDPPPNIIPATAETPSDYASAADAAFRAGDYATAASQWRHALVDDPQNGTLVLLLSQALFAQGNYDEAAGAAQAALAVLPPDKWNTVIANRSELYGDASAYAAQLGKLSDAAKQAESPALQFLLGYQLGFSGDKARAVVELDKGLKLAPQDDVMQRLRATFQGAPVPAPPQS